MTWAQVLGLELAAGWLKMMPANEIAREIEQSLDFLTTSARDVPARHRSLRSVFDHSWSLLSLEEQSVLMRLSVFRGGLTRTAAEHVTGATLPILASLMDKSLVRRSAMNRYELHELIRQYAALRLESDSGAKHTTNEKHAEYYLTLLQAREPALRSQLQKETLADLRPEMDNFRTAWDFAVADAQQVRCFTFTNCINISRRRKHFIGAASRWCELVSGILTPRTL